jgi:REP element-mobilizing transposase RayT
MAPPRIEVAGGLYHVNAKAVHGAGLFRDDVDRLCFLDRLRDQTRLSEWTILSYSLMTTHYHLLLKLRKPTLSSGFRRLNSLYAKDYNRRHARRGALWQRRFYDSLIESDEHLLEAIRYIARNATRANAATSPEEWPWCNYGSALGLLPRDPIVDEGELLALFGTRPDTARARLRAFVEEPDPRRRRGLTPV